MSSTKTTRNSLNERRQYIPLPDGCMACYTRDGTECTDPECGCSSYSCNHTAHFVAIKKALKERGCAIIGSGSFRTTYAPKNNSRYVYKVPNDHNGYCDNYFEALAWQERERVFASCKWLPGVKYGNIGHRISRCSMLPSGVLVMERLNNPDHWYDDAASDGRDPSLKDDPVRQLLVQIDNCQGGFDRNNHFRLYDFTHRVEIVDGPSHLEAL